MNKESKYDLLLQNISYYLSKPTFLLPRVGQGDPEESMAFVRYFFRPKENNELCAAIEALGMQEDPRLRAFICHALTTDHIMDLNRDHLERAIVWAGEMGYPQAKRALEFLQNMIVASSPELVQRVSIPDGCYVNAAGGNFRYTTLRSEGRPSVVNFEQAAFAEKSFDGVNISRVSLVGSNFFRLALEDRHRDAFLSRVKFFVAQDPALPFSLETFASNLKFYDRLLEQAQGAVYDLSWNIETKTDLIKRFIRNFLELDLGQLDAETRIKLRTAMFASQLMRDFDNVMSSYHATVESDSYPADALTEYEALINLYYSFSRAVFLDASGNLVMPKETIEKRLHQATIEELETENIPVTILPLFNYPGFMQGVPAVEGRISLADIIHYLSDSVFLNGTIGKMRDARMFDRFLQAYFRPSDFALLYQHVQSTIPDTATLRAGASAFPYINYALVTDDIFSLNKETLQLAMQSPLIEMQIKGSKFLAERLTCLMQLLDCCKEGKLDFSALKITAENRETFISILNGLNLSGREVINANLSQMTSLSELNLSGIKFVHGDFSRMAVNVTLVGTQFENSHLTQVYLARRNCAGVVFRDSVLDNGNFLETDLTGGQFEKVSLISTDFTGAKMEGVTFKEARFFRRDQGLSELYQAFDHLHDLYKDHDYKYLLFHAIHTDLIAAVRELAKDPAYHPKAEEVKAFLENMSKHPLMKPDTISSTLFTHSPLEAGIKTPLAQLNEAMQPFSAHLPGLDFHPDV
ncbi:MAG: pentapeptide repeat-containing protein [Candidatus Berkiellales bacterium]